MTVSVDKPTIEWYTGCISDIYNSLSCSDKLYILIIYLSLEVSMIYWHREVPNGITKSSKWHSYHGLRLKINLMVPPPESLVLNSSYLVRSVKFIEIFCKLT
jgi:hypothetical protein